MGAKVTTTTSWLSVSGTGRRTFYLGADSQGTSLLSGKVASNSLKKVYASPTSPEIFAFSGDVGWGAEFLRRLLAAITQNKVISPLGSIARAREICARAPKHPTSKLDILYGVRKGAGEHATFQLYHLTCSSAALGSWKVCQMSANQLSGTVSTQVYSSGLGGSTNVSRQSWIARGDQGDVARTCFWSLCDLVDGVPQRNIMTGGYPQLVKLDEDGTGSAVGVKYYGVPTVFGRRTSSPQQWADVWVDEYFTHLCPETLMRFGNAQRYSRPKNGR